MIVTKFTKRALSIRRERRDMLKCGWEYVSEGGGRLWELHRGYRIGFVISEVRIAADGLGLWVKCTDSYKNTPTLTTP